MEVVQITIPPSTVDIFFGHRGFGFAPAVAQLDPITIVILREPVSRIISWFDYIMHLKKPPPPIKAFQKQCKGWTLDHIVKEYHLLYTELDHSGIFTGKDSVVIPLCVRGFHQELRHQALFLCGFSCLHTDDQQLFLHRARENLEKINVVGVLEMLDDALLQMKVYLDFIPAHETSFPHENTAKVGWKSHPSEETIDKLNLYLKDEKLLYERARELSAIKTEEARVCVKSP